MVGVGGGVNYKKVNKDTALVLGYAWESYPSHKGRFSGYLPGNGETYFYLEKADLNKEENDHETLKVWVYKGGGECSFNDGWADVPDKVQDAWKKEVKKYKEANEKKLFGRERIRV